MCESYRDEEGSESLDEASKQFKELINDCNQDDLEHLLDLNSASIMHAEDQSTANDSKINKKKDSMLTLKDTQNKDQFTQNDILRFQAMQ